LNTVKKVEEPLATFYLFAIGILHISKSMIEDNVLCCVADVF